jgi:hypothetical protein
MVWPVPTHDNTNTELTWTNIHTPCVGFEPMITVLEKINILSDISLCSLLKSTDDPD